MSNLARKNNETISKATEKSKGGKNTHALCQNEEVQQNNHTSIRVDTYKYRLKNAKIQQRKNLRH